MFSVVGIKPITFAFGLSWAIARIAASVAAAPDMSYFIFSIPSAGLIEIPPESKVIPFPTIATTSVSASSAV